MPSLSWQWTTKTASRRSRAGAAASRQTAGQLQTIRRVGPSAVLERDLTLRHRGGSTTASCSRRCDGLVRAAGEERGCHSEEASAPGAHSIGVGAAVVKLPVIIDPVEFFCLAVL
ncbi:hypothetical protein SETIT_9G182100v2 [Setaria italica]|uniref:Uncharacterized protein n=1 Tax=Setaria italica TaxID=4555 RepID=A0A368SHV8_SETIT|nr:hypothetical protein SETIT_9G182100v2 [Setaria italica]